MSKVADFTLLETLVQTVTKRFKNDRTKPSVLCSWIDDNTGYYVSVGRYTGSARNNGNRNVVCSARNMSLSTAIRQATTRFIALEDTENPIERLRKMV